MDASEDLGISSALVRIQRLKQRSVRERTGLHYIEGFRNFIQAIDAGMTIETIIYTEILAQNPAVQKNVRLLKRDGVPVVRLTPETFRRVSGTARASGIGAMVRQHWTPLDQIDPRQGPCWIALRSIRSPGNLGTILRTAEAAGVGGVLLIGDDVDPFDPAVVRASMGGIFPLKLVRTTLPQFTAWAARTGCCVWGTTPGAEALYTEAPVDPPLVVLFGDERKGLSPGELAACTQLSRIPMVGRADSLNVGVAAGIILFEVVRRRSFPPANNAASGADSSKQRAVSP